MINVKDLRVGNIVMLEGRHIAPIFAIDVRNNTIVTENPHNKTVSGLTGDEWSADSDFLTPVPLSPEVLEATGFNAFNYKELFVKKYNEQGELMLFKTDSPIARANDFPPGKLYYSFNAVAHIIDYLHQLQNLYHALTGTELTINQLTK